MSKKWKNKITTLYEVPASEDENARGKWLKVQIGRNIRKKLKIKKYKKIYKKNTGVKGQVSIKIIRRK